MSDAPERITHSCVYALGSYQQGDVDGELVLVSRQAIHETINAYWDRVGTCEKLELKLANAVQALADAAKQHRIIARMDITRASAVAYNAAHPAEKIIAELKGETNG